MSGSYKTDGSTDVRDGRHPDAAQSLSHLRRILNASMLNWVFDLIHSGGSSMQVQFLGKTPRPKSELDTPTLKQKEVCLTRGANVSSNFLLPLLSCSVAFVILYLFM